jgi:hypothetical protein
VPLRRAHERAARAAGMPPEPRNYTPIEDTINAAMADASRDKGRRR